MTTRLNYFISYAHQDKPQVDRLLDLLRPQLAIAAGFEFSQWHDTRIPVGDDWAGEIQAALRSSDFGLLMLSPAFLASGFIGRHELPHFLRPAGPNGTGVAVTKPVVPVGLKPVPLDGSARLQGLEHLQLFRDHQRRWFNATRGHVSDAFAAGLAAAICSKFNGAP